MASTFKVVKKAVTLPPTVRTLSSGVPHPTLVNLAAAGGGGHHSHGHSGPRSDMPPKWSGGVTRTSSGLVSKTFVTCTKIPAFFYFPKAIPDQHPSAPVNTFSQQRYIHTSTPAKDAPNVPDFSGYQASSSSNNRALQYFMVGSLGVLSASVAKSTVAEFLGTMAASADVLALAKVEVELSSIPEGKNVIIKWRGKPVFIRHRTPDEIEEANTIDWKTLRDPESDEARVKKPEWLVMLGVCTHLGCVPIGEAGDFGGWCVTFDMRPSCMLIVSLPDRFCPCHGSHYDICVSWSCLSLVDS